MASTFKIDPKNYLSINWSRYRSDIYALALAKPSVYSKIRQDVLDKVKNDATDKLYTTLFDVLNEGKVNGVPLIKDGNTNYTPNYPEQKINEYCLSACRTMESIVHEAIGILLRIDINKIIQSRYADIGKLPEPNP